MEHYETLGYKEEANVYYRQFSFYARVTFLKNVAQIEDRIPIKNNVFSGG
jgi:hypothetical protein